MKEHLPLSKEEARLLVLVLERLQKQWFKAESVPIEDQLYRLYDKLQHFSE